MLGPHQNPYILHELMSRIPLFWNYGKKFIHAYFQNILKDRDRFENFLSNGKMASTFIKKNEVFRTLKKN